MYAWRTLAVIGSVVIGCVMPAVALAQVTADDFLPPVMGGPTVVEQIDKVAMKGDVVIAATAQDAMNVAVRKNTEQLSSNIEEVGARMVQFPSGLGFVASGAAFYRTMENPVATRIAKRKAYVIAFTKAKKNLAEILGGLSNEGKETVREALLNLNLPDEEMTNISTESEEALKQTVDMMLRGFVIYEVKDDTAQNTVYASIVTTPKTRGKLARPAPNAVEADDLREGLNQVIAEVRSGLVPPVGGRVITMRATGETAVVGFGSSVVRTSSNRAAQLKLNLSAQKIAGMRAKDALCGLLSGSKVWWEGKVSDTLKDEVQEFESTLADDPLARRVPEAVRKLDQARQTFVSRLETSDEFRGLTRGILPPGVNSKTWFDDDHAWAWGISLYAPSLTKAAREAAEEMKTGPRPSGFTDEGKSKPKQPGKEVKDGPTGKFEVE